jgi:hypothetical protein
VVSEPQLKDSSSGDDVEMVSAERTVPPPLPIRDHEAVAPAVTETLVPAVELAGRGATGASASDALSTINFEVIDLDATELLRNDWDIYEVMQERMLADSVESEVEVPEPTTFVVATSAEAVVLTDREAMLGASVVGQLTPGQGDVGSPAPPTMPEVVEEVLWEAAVCT